MKLKCLLLLLVSAVVQWLLAQPFCTVRTFNIRDGLAANLISGMGQTSDGLMWVSTWNGLCCYDGYQFTTFRSMPGANEVLTSNRIIKIVPNQNGDLWLVTYDRNFYLFDTSEARFVNLTKIIRKKYNLLLFPRNIYSFPEGETWVTFEENVRFVLRVDEKCPIGPDAIELFSIDHSDFHPSYAKKIQQDSDSRVWVVTDNGTLLAGSDYRSNVSFEYMAEMDGRAYFASVDGVLACWQPESKCHVFIKLPVGIGRIHDMQQLDEHHLLLATNLGILLVDNRHQMRLRTVQTPSHPSAEVRKFFVDSRQRVWAFTDVRGVVLLDGETVSWLDAPTVPDFSSTTSSNPFWHEDQYQTVWMIPTNGTFSYYDESLHRLVPYTLQSVGYEYANLPTINKYFIDGQGNLWFSSTHDLTLVNFKYHNLKYVPMRPNEETRALLADGEGRLWIGNDHGYLAFYGSDGRCQGYLSPSGAIQSSPVKFSDRIYSLYEDRSRRLWIGTKGQGLYCRTADGRMSHYVKNAADSYSLSSNDVYSIDQDERGRLWVGTYEAGINLLEERVDSVLFYNSNNAFTGYLTQKFSKVRRVTHTGNGVIILSTTGGLVTFSNHFSNPREIRFYGNSHVMGDASTLLASDVLQTFVTRNGRIFVATMGGGMQELVSDNLLQNKLEYRHLNRFASDEGNVLAMVEDAKGDLWVTRETTIDRYTPSTGDYLQYGPNDLGDRVEFSEAQSVCGSDGRVSIGAMGGFITFLPTQITRSSYVPRIVFTSIHLRGEQEARPLLNASEVVLPSDKRNVTIRFAALDYSNNYLVRYAYMVEGVDKEWTYVGTSHQASFNHLPSGHHRLLVKSTNSDGVWVDNLTVLNIYAEPTFWESIWGKLLLLLIVATIGYVAFRFYNLRNKARMEREISDMKSRFFTDISHKLRTPLTLIGGPVTEVLNAGGLSDMARRHLVMVRRNALNMLELVNKMLQYSKDSGTYISETVTDTMIPVTQENDGDADNTETLVAQNASTTILVVEDNDDLREFLSSILSDEYHVILAENGQKGLETAEQCLPDFIITDVMMPVMDGLSMVQRIKQNKDICHIPIIVLSAKASMEDRLQGLSAGIDDYITKPFSAVYLKTRVHNIIAQRSLLQQTYLEQLAVSASSGLAAVTDSAAVAADLSSTDSYRLESPQIVDVDKEMMKSLMSYLEEHVSDADLRIEDLAYAVNLGRSVFYGKLKAIVGMSPVDFLRHVRIQRAEELIKKSSYPVSQIAYSVGFSDPKYFSKCFKKETGMTPSEYREKTGEQLS